MFSTYDFSIPGQWPPYEFVVVPATVKPDDVHVEFRKLRDFKYVLRAVGNEYQFIRPCICVRTQAFRQP